MTNTNEMIQLGDLMASRPGTVNPLNHPEEEFTLYSVPAFDSHEPEKITGRDIGSTKQVVRTGDVLLSKIVPHIRRAWVVGTHEGSRIIASSEWIVFRGNNIHAPYLRHVLVGDAFHRQFMNTVAGVGGSLLRARPAHVANIAIPLPPMADQKRIAATLDRVDSLRAKRRRATSLLDDLTQSIFLDMFGDPVANPQRLKQVPLTEACTAYSGGTPSKGNPENWEGEVPWFSAKDLKQSDLFRSEDTINAEIPKKTSLRLLPANTVAIVVRGMILAHSFPVCVLRVPSTINQDLKALLPKHELDAQFLAHCLRAQKSHALKQVSQAAHGTTRLDAQGLGNIKVLLPTPERQQEFARRVAAVRALKQNHEAHLAALEELFTSLQQRAFSGALWDHEAAA